MPTLEFPLPVAESGRAYAPGTLARELRGFERTPQGTLRTMRGPAPLVPNYGAGYPAQYSRMYGCYHARLSRSVRDVMLFRTGDKLIEQRGWQRNMRTLETGLSDDPTQRFADQFCTVGGKIIWTNGRDRARIYDGYTMLPLGYVRAPSTPTARGPATSGHPVFKNDVGYSHPGKVGSIGEVYADDEGTLLPFERYYAVQFEDEFGNLSPLSPLAGPVSLRTERTASFYWDNYDNYPDVALFGGGGALGLLSVRLDDLTRQFWLEGIPLGPTGTRARRVYATENAVTEGRELRLLVRIPDNITTAIPDNFPDAALGSVAEDVIPVPIFSVMSPHLGGLAIAVGPRIYLSQPGFPGTFLRTRYVEPDPQGGEITGLASWMGNLYAWTETSTYRILDDAEGLRHRPVSNGIGCMAPGSIRSTGLQVLIWLARDGFYAMDAEGAITRISEEIDPLFVTLNTSHFGQATATWRSKTQEYLCAVPVAGAGGNPMVLQYSASGWRRLMWDNLQFAGLFETQDWTQRLLAVGRRTDTNENNIWVLNAQHRDYDAGGKTTLFRSAWIKPDVFGRKRFTAATIYIGIVETGDHAITFRLYRNYRQDQQVGSDRTFTAYAPDLDRLAEKDASLGTAATLAAVTVGTDHLRMPRMTWKQVQVRLAAAESFSFDLTCSEPAALHLHAIAFQFELEDAGEMISKE